MILDLRDKDNVKMIVDGCVKGDRRLQNALFETLYGKMMAVAMRYSIDESEAKEIISNSFLKVFDKIKGFRLEGSLEGWVRRIVVNTALDCLRKKKFDTFNIIDKVKHENLKHEDEEFELECIRTVKDISTAEILAEVQNLSPVYKAVFNMFVFDGYTHKEIGEELGIAEGTSKSNLLKAKRALKKRLLNLQNVEILNLDKCTSEE